jgi:hypothetical protein
MNADDLQDLYNALRGSRSALAVLDARTLFMEKQMVKAHARLLDAHTTYQESRSRLLKQDPEQQYDPKSKEGDRQIRRLKRKQEKAREILEVFDGLLPQLAKLARREQARQAAAPAPAQPVARAKPAQQQASGPVAQPAPTAPDVPAPTSDADQLDDQHVESPLELEPARPASLSEKFLDDFQENWGDDQLHVVGRHYGFTPVESDEDIHMDALYYLRKGDDSILVQTSSADAVDAVALINVVNQKPLRPLPRDTFIELGRQRKMVLLLQRHSVVANVDGEAGKAATEDAVDAQRTAGPADTAQSQQATAPPAAELNPEQKFLDMGAFSQLMESAQRSGLVPGADQIGFTRDREFRLGNYDLALQIIEGLFSKFTANAAARKQKLTREEADIAAGRIMISPKDLLAKRARDRAQNQAIERARSRFNRVLDGLRVLIKNS